MKAAILASIFLLACPGAIWATNVSVHVVPGSAGQTVLSQDDLAAGVRDTREIYKLSDSEATVVFYGLLARQEHEDVLLNGLVQKWTQLLGADIPREKLMALRQDHHLESLDDAELVFLVDASSGPEKSAAASALLQGFVRQLTDKLAAKYTIR